MSAHLEFGAHPLAFSPVILGEWRYLGLRSHWRAHGLARFCLQGHTALRLEALSKDLTVRKQRVSALVLPAKRRLVRLCLPFFLRLTLACLPVSLRGN